MKRHSSIAQQGVLIVEQMSSLQRDPSLLHLLIFACFSKAHRTENLQCGRTNICFDVGSLSVKWIEMVWKCLKPCSESRFGTRRKRNCKGNAKPSKHTIYKALQTRNFLLANDNDENDFGSNPNTSQEEGWCWSTMSPRKTVTRIQDSKVGSLRGFASSCWNHLTKHCETIQTIRPHHYHPHAYAASLQVADKRTKSNILRQLSLSPLKRLKDTPKTEQNLRVMEYAECLCTGKRHHCNLFQCLYQHPKCIRVVLGKAAKSTGKVRWDICSMRPAVLEHTCDGSIPSMRDKSSWAWFMWWQKWVFDGQCKPIGWIGLSLWRRYRIYQIMESCSKPGLCCYVSLGS